MSTFKNFEEFVSEFPTSKGGLKVFVNSLGELHPANHIYDMLKHRGIEFDNLFKIFRRPYSVTSSDGVISIYKEGQPTSDGPYFQLRIKKGVLQCKRLPKALDNPEWRKGLRQSALTLLQFLMFAEEYIGYSGDYTLFVEKGKVTVTELAEG